MLTFSVAGRQGRETFFCAKRDRKETLAGLGGVWGKVGELRYVMPGMPRIQRKTSTLLCGNLSFIVTCI